MVIGVAVVGCGQWGQNLVRNFAALGALRAVVDANEERARYLSEAHSVPALALDEALASSDVDAVVIAAPAIEHAALARRVIESGKDVFVEKPLALDIDEAQDLVGLAGANGRVLMVGHLMQYHPAFVALRRIVDGGELGRVQYIYSNRLNLGRFRREESILWSFAPHDVSMILSLVGEEPDDVQATASAYLHNQIADVTTTHLSFPGGASAHVFVSWLHPFKEQKLVVVGDRAMAVLDDMQPWESKLVLYGHRIEWRNGIPEALPADARPVDVARGEPLAEECRHFLECVRDRRPPLTDGEEGLRVLRVLRRAHEALTTPRLRAGADPAVRAGDVFVHPSSYIDDGCRIGTGTRIWHFSHVLSGSEVGRDCNIGQNVVIGPDVRIGDRCRIQNNVSVYSGVTLEDDVFCGPSCVFTNVTTPRASVSRKDELVPTAVRRGASIGANATIVCGNEIGAYALVAAGAVVTEDVPPHALVAGVPARQIGWVSHDGEVLGDDLVCRRSGRRYELFGGTLVECR